MFQKLNSLPKIKMRMKMVILKVEQVLQVKLIGRVRMSLIGTAKR